ncbi:cytochrome c oxidase subunit VIIc domain-containing protein [Phthorimaea operculella]|nr:cytochrome c oxidase subunit VIIc domain-containing protein [Phthorimaea operculella]
MLGPVARISNQVGRNVVKTIIRNSSQGGIPGQNMPFNIHNKTRLTLNLFVYGFTGFVAPFLILQWQLMKK